MQIPSLSPVHKEVRVLPMAPKSHFIILKVSTCAAGQGSDVCRPVWHALTVFHKGKKKSLSNLNEMLILPGYRSKHSICLSTALGHFPQNAKFAKFIHPQIAANCHWFKEHLCVCVCVVSGSDDVHWALITFSHYLLERFSSCFGVWFVWLCSWNYLQVSCSPASSSSEYHIY